MVVAALNTLAVCDTDREFVKRLAAYAAAKAGYPFSLQVFSATEQLFGWLEKKQPEAVLLASELYRKKDWAGYGRPVFLLGGSFGGEEDRVQIFRYQEAEGILRDIVTAYTALVPEVHAGGIKGSFRLYVVTDATETAATEWLAWELAVQLAATQKVLFANLRAWPVTAQLAGPDWQADLGELLYYLCEKPTELMGQLMARSAGWQGVDLLPVAQVPADLGQVQIREWKVLWDTLQRDSPYTAVVVVAGTLLQPAEDFLALFDEVWLVKEQGQKQKLALWKAYMGAKGSAQMMEKLKVVCLPPEMAAREAPPAVLEQLVRQAMERGMSGGDKGS